MQNTFNVNTDNMPALATLLNYIANNNLTDVEVKLIEQSLQNLNQYSLQLQYKK